MKRKRDSSSSPLLSLSSSLSPPSSACPSPSLHRLFIGGCPVSLLSRTELHRELQQRFQPFGNVTQVDVIGQDSALKGFAYVSILCGEAKFTALLSTFRHTTWKGQTFRVEVAKPDYRQRLILSQRGKDEPGKGDTVGSRVDWSHYEYRFHDRPGHRLRIPAGKSVSLHQDERNSNHNQTALTDITAIESELQQQVEYQQQADKARHSQTNIQLMKQQLDAWKQEVEQQWITPEQSHKAQPKPHTKEPPVRQKTTTAAATIDSSDLSELSSEEELDVVDFMSDEDDDNQQLDNEGNHLTAEQRRQREEQQDWGRLERYRYTESDTAMETGSIQLDRHQFDNPQQNYSSHTAPNDDDDDLWTAIEKQKTAPPNSSVSLSSASLASAATAPVFPKKSVSEWFDDDSPADANDGDAADSLLKPAASSTDLSLRVRAEYEGAAGQELLQIKKTFGNDPRFAFDERFATAAAQQEKQETHQQQQQQPTERSLAGDDTQKSTDRETLEHTAGAATSRLSLKRQLHDETVRALQVLDSVLPGPHKFHVTLPRFSSPRELNEANNTNHAAAAPLTDAQKTAAVKELELNDEAVKKSVLLWKNINRFDPDKPEQQTGKSKKNQKNQKNQNKQKQKQKLSQQLPIHHDSEGLQDDLPVQHSDDDGGEGRTKWTVNVVRLRDLITDPSTVVSFSVSTRTEDETNINSTATQQTHPTVQQITNNQLTPHSPAPTHIARQQQSAVSTTLHPASTTGTTTSVVTASERSSPTHKPTLSELLSIAQRHSSALPQASRPHVQESNSSEDSDDDGGSVFMRSSDSATTSPAAWSDVRAQIRADYKKKRKDAVKKENQRTKASTATVAAAARRQRKQERSAG